jgi:hypothetical protein
MTAVGRCDVRALMCSIARAVTVESMDEEDAITKYGEGCLFSVMQTLLPEVCQCWAISAE